MSKESKADIARQAMQAATRLVAVPDGASPLDCDVDGMVEPLPYATAGAGIPYPTGGGLIPTVAGAAKTDPWGNAYGYCVWDHGLKTLVDNVVACGGTGALRRPGGNVIDAIVVAIISAGPNKTFQSSCLNWVNASTPLINKMTASDDIVVTATMEELMAGGDTKIQYHPDAACIPSAVGLMRMDVGVIQICTEDGWEEVGADVAQSGNFTPVTGAALSSVNTSNQISFSGFHGEKPISVDNGAIILVNGVVKSSNTTIKAGDLVSLRANASATPEVTLTFTLTLQHQTTAWTVRTRNFFPAVLSITPSTKSNMNVVGPGAPTAYGATDSFLVRNTGEITTTAMLASLLSNTTNFEFDSTGAFVGDGCSGQILAGNATCVLDVRPKATTGGAISSTLTARTASLNAVANLSGNASGMGCARPWGGAQIVHTGSVSAYQTATVPFGGTCASQVRTCTNGVLSGSYTFENCTVSPPALCDSPWGGPDIAHGANVTAYQAASVPFGNTCTSETRTCTNGSLSGAYTFGSCSVGSPATCARPWGGAAIPHGGTITAYQTDTANSCLAVDQVRTCNNGTLSGSYTEQACSDNCNAPWGVWITHGTSVTAYSAATSNSCIGIDQTRTCTDGVFSGTYTFGACNDNCSWAGVWVNHGASRAFYTATTGDCPTIDQLRTCNDGVLTGSATYDTADCNDTVPAAFAFTNLTDQALSTLVTSNIMAVTGIGSNVAISMSGAGGAYRICANATCSSEVLTWRTAAATIDNGQYVQLRTTTAATGATADNTNVTVGSYTETWTVTTQDNAPGAFIFTNLTDQSLSTLVTSNIVAVTGIGSNVGISMSGAGGAYRICANATCSSEVLTWRTAVATIDNGQYVQLRATTASTGNTADNTSLTVGTYTETWTITTQDNAPGAFAFTNLTDQPRSTLVTSNVVAVTGIGSNVAISMTGAGGAYRICTTAACSTEVLTWRTGAATIDNGQYVQLRTTTSASWATADTTNLTVGTFTESWTATTSDATPNAFTFTNLTNQNASDLVESNIVQVAGIGSNIPISIAGGGGAYRICANATCSSVPVNWRTTAYTIDNGQYVQVRVTTAATSTTAITTNLTIGTYTEAWSATTGNVCPSNFVERTYGCYWYSGTNGVSGRFWNAAQSYCNSLGANLVKINNATENSEVNAMGSGGHDWIGGQWNGSAWVWYDGSAMSFSYWYTGEPNGSGGADGNTMLSNGWGGKWDDVGGNCCGNTFGFICERPFL